MGGDIAEWILSAGDHGPRVAATGVTRAHGAASAEDLTQIEQMEADKYDDRLKQVIGRCSLSLSLSRLGAWFIRAGCGHALSSPYASTSKLKLLLLLYDGIRTEASDSARRGPLAPLPVSRCSRAAAATPHRVWRLAASTGACGSGASPGRARRALRARRAIEARRQQRLRLRGARRGGRRARPAA